MVVQLRKPGELSSIITSNSGTFALIRHLKDSIQRPLSSPRQTNQFIPQAALWLMGEGTCPASQTMSRFSSPTVSRRSRARLSRFLGQLFLFLIFIGSFTLTGFHRGLDLWSSSLSSGTGWIIIIFNFFFCCR